jgi:hypothetical protein
MFKLVIQTIGRVYYKGNSGMDVSQRGQLCDLNTLENYKIQDVMKNLIISN